MGHDQNMISTFKGNQWHVEFLCTLDPRIDVKNLRAQHFFAPHQLTIQNRKE